MKGRGKQLNDCPLTFPEFSLVDNATHCKTFTSLANTEIGPSNLNLEQLEPLKDDLEILLASVTERVATLTQEHDVLTEWVEAKKSEHSMLDEEVSESTKSARSTPVVDKALARNLRDTPNRSETNSPAPARSKHKQEKHTKPPAAEALGRQPKSDAPEKFWAIVEPYCSDISPDDTKSLEELMKSHEDDVDCYKIPSLGKHFSLKWQTEDSEQERKDGAKFNEKRKMLVAGQKRRLDSTGETSCSSVEEMSSKASTAGNASPTDGDDLEESPFGPLTQRLVAALLEENIMGSVDDAEPTDTDGMKTMDESISQVTPSMLAKQLNISNAMQLDRRIRAELEQLGILSPEDAIDSEDGDEILAELKQKQQELRAVGQHNLNMTKQLYRLAKDEMAKQDLKRKLATVDADVMEAYKRVVAARQKKRPPTKREKDTVMKALKERDALIKQIDSIGPAVQLSL
ncbi:transcriptional adapter 3-B-like isoform X2 [Watersipora subatra]|uniref:transcriptional adapter 3-B-like isoform X2 n=1 Tax=Watersipora subatra TaxID=2589382 RepID=UPI00355BE750